MQAEYLLKKCIKRINRATWLLFALGMIVYSPFISQQLNSADVNVYGYLYHTSYGYENDLGRFFIKFFDMWRNSIVSVAIIIPLSILLLCLVGELTCDVLGIEREHVRFIAGAFILFSPAMADLFSYAYTADSYTFAFFLAALSAYLLLKKDDNRCRIIAVIPMVVLTGIYQAYICYTVWLITLWFLKNLLYGRKCIKRALLAYITSAAAMVVYMVVFKILGAVGYLHMDSERGYDNIIGEMFKNLVTGIAGAYTGFVQYFFTSDIINNDWFFRKYINAAVFILAAVVIFICIIKNRIYKKPIEFAITLVLIILMPLVFCMIVILAADASIYAETGLLMLPFMNGLYIVPLAIAGDWEPGHGRKEYYISLAERIVSVIALVVMAVFIQCFARLVDEEQKQLTSLATRMVYSIESMEDYEPGEKVMVTGRPHNGNYPIPDEHLETITKGMISHYTQIFGADDQISTGWINAMEYYVGVKFTAVDREEMEELLASDEVASMDIYPDASSVKKIGDVVVVKLSD